jgi:hypothetical protein
MPLHHFAYYVPPALFDAEVAFLLAALKHMHYAEQMRPLPTVVGIGTPDDLFLWVVAAEDTAAAEETEAKGKGGLPLPHFALKAAGESSILLCRFLRLFLHPAREGEG